jgi:hypothetical protein
MSDRIALIMSHYYEVGSDCIRVSQPTTDVEVLLTGTTRRVWEQIERVRGVRVSELVESLSGGDGNLAPGDVVGIVEHLRDLRLIGLEEEGGW